ncbi:hypothetical protein ACQ4PT_058534 [Festuca glaucescens]
MLFAALSRHIFIGNTINDRSDLLYDTQAGALTVVPRVPHESPLVAIPPADGVSDDDESTQQHRLYAATSECDESKEHLVVSFNVMSWAPSSSQWRFPTHEWSWKSVPSSSSPSPATSPFDWAEESIAALAVHPDGHTIFLSTEGRDLDAWVGLHRDGHLCSCQVAAADSSAPAPQCKTTGETLLHADHEQRLGATLACIGGGRYCVVESVVRDDPVCRMHIMGDRGGCALRVTLFGLKHDCKGDLKITAHRTTASYAVPKYVDGFSPRAFWM